MCPTFKGGLRESHLASLRVRCYSRGLTQSSSNYIFILSSLLCMHVSYATRYIRYMHAKLYISSCIRYLRCIETFARVQRFITSHYHNTDECSHKIYVYTWFYCMYISFMLSTFRCSSLFRLTRLFWHSTTLEEKSWASFSSFKYNTEKKMVVIIPITYLLGYRCSIPENYEIRRGLNLRIGLFNPRLLSTC